MTTAHRPTWAAAVGGSNQGGNKMLKATRAFSAQDLPGYTVMKERQPGQGKTEELLAKDFKAELLEKEKKHFDKKNQKDTYGINEDSEQGDKIIKKIKHDQNQDITSLPKDDDVYYENPFPQDADDDNFKNDDDSDSSNKSNSEHDDNDDDSDDEALMKEFEKIKKEREEEQKKKLIEKQNQPEYVKNKERDIMAGNPLLEGGSYSLNKRWYEDTVFKNQTHNEPKEVKRFVNDNIRSDFHRKFLNKYVIN